MSRIYLVDDSGNNIFKKPFFPYRPQRKAAKTDDYIKALMLWVTNDSLHFENENGIILDPFTLNEE